jgi:GcrA cell cycle regulator
MSLTHEATAPSPYRNGSNSGWTDERVALLVKLQAAGLACKTIAAEIGGITRNAVIGKLTRMGLAPGRSTGVRRLREGMPTRKPRAKVERQSGLNFQRLKRLGREQGSTQKQSYREEQAAELRERFSVVEIVDLPAEESATAVPLAKLTDHTCRWPLGDPRDLDAMRFCGAEPYSKARRDYPYCVKHCRIAYRLPARDEILVPRGV